MEHFEHCAPGDELRYPCAECKRIYNRFGSGKALRAKNHRGEVLENVGKVRCVGSPVPGMTKFIVDFGSAEFITERAFFLHPECAKALEVPNLDVAQKAEEKLVGEKIGDAYRNLKSSCPLSVWESADGKDWLIHIPKNAMPYFLKVSPELAKKLIEEGGMERFQEIRK